MDNQYSHKVLLNEMRFIADSYDMDRNELFTPLLMARKILTTKCSKENFEKWIGNMKALYEKLDDDNHAVIYKTLAVIICKYSEEIRSAHNWFEDDMVLELGLDSGTFYSHYYDDEMMAYAHASRIAELHQRRNRSLLEIAENKSESGHVRIKAWDSLISASKEGGQVLPINVYSGQTLITNTAQNPDWSKLEGYGDESFRKRLKSKEELEEIKTIESTNGNTE